MRSRIHVWNLCSALLFGALLLWSLAALKSFTAVPQAIPVLDLIIVSLAVFRITRLVVYDTITQFVRDWFAGAQPSSLRGTVGTLINCTWCVGIWAALFVAFAYFITPYAWYVLFVLALAAIGTFLQLFANMMSWRTEQARNESLHGTSSVSVHANVCHSCGAPPAPSYPV